MKRLSQQEIVTAARTPYRIRRGDKVGMSDPAGDVVVRGVPQFLLRLGPERAQEFLRIQAEEFLDAAVQAHEESGGELPPAPPLDTAVAAEGDRGELVEVVARAVHLGLAPVVEEAAAELAELLGREVSVHDFVMELVVAHLRAAVPEVQGDR